MPSSYTSSSVVAPDEVYEALATTERIVKGRVQVDEAAVMPKSVRAYHSRAAATTTPRRGAIDTEPGAGSPIKRSGEEDDEEGLHAQYARIRKELFLDNNEDDGLRMPSPERPHYQRRPRGHHEPTLAAAPRQPPPPTWMESLRQHEPFTAASTASRRSSRGACTGAPPAASPGAPVGSPPTTPRASPPSSRSPTPLTAGQYASACAPACAAAAPVPAGKVATGIGVAKLDRSASAAELQASRQLATNAAWARQMATSGDTITSGRHLRSGAPPRVCEASADANLNANLDGHDGPGGSNLSGSGLGGYGGYGSGSGVGSWAIGGAAELTPACGANAIALGAPAGWRTPELQMNMQGEMQSVGERERYTARLDQFAAFASSRWPQKGAQLAKVARVAGAAEVRPWSGGTVSATAAARALAAIGALGKLKPYIEPQSAPHGVASVRPPSASSARPAPKAPLVPPPAPPSDAWTDWNERSGTRSSTSPPSPRRPWSPPAQGRFEPQIAQHGKQQFPMSSRRIAEQKTSGHWAGRRRAS